MSIRCRRAAEARAMPNSTTKRPRCACGQLSAVRLSQERVDGKRAILCDHAQQDVSAAAGRVKGAWPGSTLMTTFPWACPCRT
jgi:hypothetical protein